MKAVHMPLRLLKRLLPKNRTVVEGLVGQGLSFVAMLLPVAFATHTAVVNVVAAGAIAISIVWFATLALPMTYPGIRDEQEAATALKAAGWFVILIAGILCCSAAVLSAVRRPESELYGAAAMLICMSADYGMVAWLIRTDNAAGIAENRLKYGVTNLAITAPVAVLWRWDWSLVAGACLVYVVSSVWVLYSRRGEALAVIAAASRAPGRDVLNYTRHNLAHAASYLMFGFSAQVPNFIMVELGPAAAVWAAIARVLGGVGTVLVQLVTPHVDAAVSAAVREGDWGRVPSSVKAGILEAVLLCLVAGPASLAISYYLHYFDHVGSGVALDIILASGMWWITSLVVSPIQRTMSLLGLRRFRFLWDTTRCAALVAAVVLLSGTTAMLTLGAMALVWNAVYTAVVIYWLRRQITEWRRGAGSGVIGPSVDLPLAGPGA